MLWIHALFIVIGLGLVAWNGGWRPLGRRLPGTSTGGAH